MTNLQIGSPFLYSLQRITYVWVQVHLQVVLPSHDSLVG